MVLLVIYVFGLMKFVMIEIFQKHAQKMMKYFWFSFFLAALFGQVADALAQGNLKYMIKDLEKIRPLEVLMTAAYHKDLDAKMKIIFNIVFFRAQVFAAVCHVYYCSITSSYLQEKFKRRKNANEEPLLDNEN